MEPHLKERQYDYKETMGRVINMVSDSRRHNEPSGEADTLKGKISHKMGDKASFSKPTDNIRRAFTKTAKPKASEIPQGIFYYPKRITRKS